MKKLLFILLLLVSIVSFSQSIYPIRADSTKLEKVGGGNELILLNSTKDINGYLYNPGTGRTVFQTIGSSLGYFEDIFDLINSTVYLQGVNFSITSGFYETNDGGGASYWWQPAATSNDGVLFVKPAAISSSDPGRWELLFYNSINIKQLGALSDSTTDVKPYIEIAKQALTRIPLHPAGIDNGYGTIIIPRGKYFCSDSITFRNTINIQGEGAGTYPFQETQINFGVQKGGFYFLEANDGSGARGCHVSNLWLSSAGTNYRQDRHGIFSNTFIFLENVMCGNFSGDGFMIDTRDSGNANASVITNCYADYNRRYGFSFWGNDANALNIRQISANANGGSNIHDQSFLGNRYFGFHSSFAGIREPDNKSYVNRGGIIYGAWNPSTGIQPGVTVGWQDYWVQQNNLPIGWTTTWSADSTYFDACAFWGMGASAANDIYGSYAEGGQIGYALSAYSKSDGGANGAGMVKNYMLWVNPGAHQYVIKGSGVYNYDKDSINTYTALNYGNGLEIGSIKTGMGILQQKAFEADTTVHVYVNSIGDTRLSYPLRNLIRHTEFGRDTVWGATPIIQYSGLYLADADNTNYLTSRKRNFSGGTAAPVTDRESAAGDFILYTGTDPSIIGFRCTVAGRPGTWVQLSTSGGSAVTAVNGTSNRITSSGGTTPTIDISASYVGQSSLTTLGTIGTGTWQGTLIGSTYGGTGVNNGSNTLTLAGNLATSGANALTFTTTGSTNVTLPTTGTLVNSAGNVATATALATGRTISITGDLAYTSPSFDGTGNVTAGGTLATVASAGTTGSSTAIPVITINAKGLTTSITTAAVVAPAGTLTGTTLASGVTTSSLTSVGTIGTGVWQGTVLGATYGGTGVNNASRTLTINTNSGTINFSGASKTLTVPLDASVSGTNTGDQTVTLTGDVTGTGTGSFATTASANLKISKEGVTVDGMGGVITTGSKGYTVVPYNGTITNWYVVGDASGSIQFDIKRSGTSIIGAGNKPILSSAQRANAAVSGWTSVTVTANDELEWVVDSASTIVRANMIIYITRN